MKIRILSLLFFLVCINNARAFNGMNDSVNCCEDIYIELYKIEFSLTENTIYNKKEIIKWHYPYQMLFWFKITNKSNDSVIFISKEYFFNQEVEIYGKLRIHYNNLTYIIGSNSYVNLLPLDESFFIGYNTDLPFFEEIYTKNKFSKFLKDFISESELYYIPIYADYDKLSEFRVSNLENDTLIRITLSNDFKYVISNLNDSILDFYEIGYPYKEVPKSVKIIKPIPGIEY